MPISFLEPLTTLYRKSPVDYEQRLFDAIERSDYAAAQELVVTSYNDISWKNGTIASVNCYNDTGHTPLIQAIKKELPQLVRLLLLGGANPNQLGRTNTQSPLIIASQRGCTTIADHLLQAGAEVNYQDENGDTALLLACYNNQVPTTRLLLGSKANIDHQATYGDSALLMASRKGHNSIVLMLIEAGASLELQDGYAHTALCHASKNGHTSVVKALCNAHVNVNHQEHTGKTALIIASIHGHDEIAHTLIATHADVNLFDQDGCSALIYAILYNRTVIAHMLIGAGADVNSKHKSQANSPLLLASHNCRLDTVRALIRADADINAHNNRGLSPLLGVLIPGISCEPFAPPLPSHHPNTSLKNVTIRELLLRGAEPNEEEKEFLTAEQLALVITRREAVHQKLIEFEKIYGIPRDISRLIGTCAELSDEHNLPPPTYRVNSLS